MLKPLKLGNITFKNPIFLAPMAGVTDFPYRKMIRSFGCDLAYSEMVSSMSMVVLNEKTKRISNITKDTRPIAIQIAGSNLDVMSQATKIASNSGADIIDINMGCPAKKVISGIAGSALMKDLDLARRVINTVVNSTKLPVTLKMRLGWDDNSINAPTLAKYAEEEGIKLITVHGRTRAQFYKGQANWKIIKDIKKQVKIPVIANGDIINLKTAQTALKDSGADGLMIGRGTYGKPWLINHIVHYLNTKVSPPEPNINERYNITINHYNDIINYYGSENGVKIARKHLGWHIKGLNNASKIRGLINTKTNIKEIKELIKVCFNQ